MGEDNGRMAIRKWLWPKLETTEDAERELRNAAGWFLVFVVMELVGAIDSLRG